MCPSLSQALIAQLTSNTKGRCLLHVPEAACQGACVLAAPHTAIIHEICCAVRCHKWGPSRVHLEDPAVVPGLPHCSHHYHR